MLKKIHLNTYKTFRILGLPPRELNGQKRLLPNLSSVFRVTGEREPTPTLRSPPSTPVLGQECTHRHTHNQTNVIKKTKNVLDTVNENTTLLSYVNLKSEDKHERINLHVQGFKYIFSVFIML